MARKLAVILHRMLRDGSDFRWSAREVQAVYRTRLLGQLVGLRGAPEGLLLPGGAPVGGAAMAVLLDQP
ncbi:hypothetical protein, partial [Paracraurococcus ruber]|uniref:hypothetical protein n=1 Tax=Paracraurococcus ruber TaxID=77675 RepID=UPI001864554F